MILYSPETGKAVWRSLRFSAWQIVALFPPMEDEETPASVDPCQEAEEVEEAATVPPISAADAEALAHDLFADGRRHGGTQESQCKAIASAVAAIGKIITRPKQRELADKYGKHLRNSRGPSPKSQTKR